jgi:hypothetical protein
VAEYYDIRQEGHKEAWDTTPGATPEDWDKALEIAQERAASQGRNYVIRHVDRERTQLIVTATPDEGLAWPRYGVPPLKPGELDREAEAGYFEPSLAHLPDGTPRVVQAVSHDAALEALNDLEHQADREMGD